MNVSNYRRSLICGCSILVTCISASRARMQVSSMVHREPDQTWAGKRIAMLKGFGDYYVTDEHGTAHLVKSEGLGVNIVAVVQRVEGNHVWIKANGAGDVGVGWVDKTDVILLEDAISHFTLLIQRNPNDWDAYLRRAESEHSLNQRDAAIADYTTAIKLHPDESFLYLRRGREYRIMKACGKAVADFNEVTRLNPQWPEPYNLEAGVYSDCPDPQFRDWGKAMALIQHAIALDVQHPTYLTVLAFIYEESGELEKAVVTQRQALESPRFPSSYREEAEHQLHEYEKALAAKPSKALTQ